MGAIDMGPSTDRKTMTVEEAAKELGIGRRLAYELAGRGELPGVLRLGRRLVVSRAVLEATLAPSNVTVMPQVDAGEPDEAA